MAMLMLRISTQHCIYLLIRYIAHWDVDPNTQSQGFAATMLTTSAATSSDLSLNWRI